jgi:phenylacetate-CoA oxygenase PaaI subunit
VTSHHADATGRHADATGRHADATSRHANATSRDANATSPDADATSPDTDATATMISLIGSLADNKGALGRRYGEWAISAPTIESAVAAAAMAQDELGHARATYPVLAKLGVTREDDTLHTGHPIEALQTELPDWASLIAANLVVDGILTTFVSTARDSSIEPLAQRARKILQEEGAHKVHAEAWARRIKAVGGADSELLTRRITELWAQAARWPGPDEHPGYAAAIAQGMVSEGPDAIRDRVRRWMIDLFGAEHVEPVLTEPTDWSGWDEERRQ